PQRRGSTKPGNQSSSTRRIRSSDFAGSPRPSVLLVVTHNAPSGAVTTLRRRPYSSSSSRVWLPVLVPDSRTAYTHSPCSAPRNAVEEVIAIPAGEHSSVGQVTFGWVKRPAGERPSTSGHPSFLPRPTSFSSSTLLSPNSVA